MRKDNDKGVTGLGVVFIVAVVALLLALGGFMYAYSNHVSVQTDIDELDLDTVEGPAGIQGPQGLAGADGADGEDGADGIDGADGAPGPQGPKGDTGATGPQGPAGEDGEDLAPNSPPTVIDHGPEGYFCYCDAWNFFVELDDAEDDLMKVEFYLYIDFDWFEYTCLDILPCVMDHYWLPVYNEVGYDGIYELDLSELRDIVACYTSCDLMDCIELTWRVDITSCGCFTSYTWDYIPCTDEEFCGYCDECIPCEFCPPCEVPCTQC